MNVPPDSTVSRQRVMILGNTRTAEMRPVTDAVLRYFGNGELRCVPSVSHCEKWVAPEWSPELVIICQNWPDEFPRNEVLNLIKRFPQSRWVCCFGLWCESDGRNRDLWPLGSRIPARMAALRLREEQRVQEQEIESLPLTAGRDESFEFDYGNAAKRLPHVIGLTVTAWSPDTELRRLWKDMLEDAGLALVDADDEASPDVILQDTDPWNADSREQLRELRRQFEGAQLIALTNFSRPIDLHELTRAGADVVVSKLAGCRAVLEAIESPAHGRGTAANH